MDSTLYDSERRIVAGRMVRIEGRGRGRAVVRGSWEGRGRMVADRILPEREGRGGGLEGGWVERGRMVAGRIVQPRSVGRRSSGLHRAWEEKPRMVGGRILHPRSSNYQKW